jgi:hypothetical protein
MLQRNFAENEESMRRVTEGEGMGASRQDNLENGAAAVGTGAVRTEAAAGVHRREEGAGAGLASAGARTSSGEGTMVSAGSTDWGCCWRCEHEGATRAGYAGNRRPVGGGAGRGRVGAAGCSGQWAGSLFRWAVAVGLAALLELGVKRPAATSPACFPVDFARRRRNKTGTAVISTGHPPNEQLGAWAGQDASMIFLRTGDCFKHYTRSNTHAHSPP